MNPLFSVYKQISQFFSVVGCCMIHVTMLLIFALLSIYLSPVPSSYMLSTLAFHVRGAFKKDFWKNLGFCPNQAVRDVWKTFFQPPEICELCYELPMTSVRRGARSTFQIVSSSCLYFSCNPWVFSRSKNPTTMLRVKVASGEHFPSLLGLC